MHIYQKISTALGVTVKVVQFNKYMGARSDLSVQVVLQAGQRGSLYGPDDYEVAADLGIRLVPWQELRHWTPAQFGEAVEKRAGDAPLFLSFDIDFVDPGVAPGTGTPEVGGPSADQALDFVRALKGRNLIGGDVVEVAPQYDGPGQQTALMAANVLYEMLSLIALRRA